MNTSSTSAAEVRPAVDIAALVCPDWCAHTETCDPASLDDDGLLWHQSAVAVSSTAEHSGVSARLELFDHPAFRDEYPHRYNVEICGDLDVPIEHARALGEYLIAMADRVEESERT